ncbi:hypothetical protein ACQEV4_22825 [Streptomyces shenzhenensis]|uniref:hypothetical protein n=1 Tax=Streptomyces shenzhenensis TaxID=943815 RepID=UPI003D8DCBED
MNTLVSAGPSCSFTRPNGAARQELQSSLTHAKEKIAQLDVQIARKQVAVDLGGRAP